jgi:hypothetical protein
MPSSKREMCGDVEGDSPRIHHRTKPRVQLPPWTLSFALVFVAPFVYLLACVSGFIVVHPTFTRLRLMITIVLINISTLHVVQRDLSDRFLVSLEVIQLM